MARERTSLIASRRGMITKCPYLPRDRGGVGCCIGASCRSEAWVGGPWEGNYVTPEGEGPLYSGQEPAHSPCKLQHLSRGGRKSSQLQQNK